MPLTGLGVGNGAWKPTGLECGSFPATRAVLSSGMAMGPLSPLQLLSLFETFVCSHLSADILSTVRTSGSSVGSEWLLHFLTGCPWLALLKSGCSKANVPMGLCSCGCPNSQGGREARVLLRYCAADQRDISPSCLARMKPGQASKAKF